MPAAASGGLAREPEFLKLGTADRRAQLELNAASYARIAVQNIRREYPVQESYVVTGPGRLPLPRERHPAFYGSFDWHSCVEMHWVVVRLLRTVARLPRATEAREALDEDLTPASIQAEAAYLREQPRFERPYGWGWALTLAHELVGWEDPDASRWLESLRPLTDVITAHFLEWLPRATYPLRTGLHGNSAFGLTLALPFARNEAALGRPELHRAIVDAAMRWYAGDVDYPADWEPSGTDFLSPALTEAVLMLEIMDRSAFIPWLDRFLPQLSDGAPSSLLGPVIVSDPTDGQIAHLHGLNLSRAWCMRRIAEALPQGDPRTEILEAAGARHADASLAVVTGSDYMVEHWLAAYAVLLLGS